MIGSKSWEIKKSNPEMTHKIWITEGLNMAVQLIM